MKFFADYENQQEELRQKRVEVVISESHTDDYRKALLRLVQEMHEDKKSLHVESMDTAKYKEYLILIKGGVILHYSVNIALGTIDRISFNTLVEQDSVIVNSILEDYLKKIQKEAEHVE